MFSGDTIAAIATAPGRGGVAVIRVSGPSALAIAEKLTGLSPQPGRIRLATFRHPDHGEELDQGLLLTFAGPHSYTGEDTVELQSHGGEVTPRRILEACLAAGARLARRGEFTERALLNGKLDYDQAESVLDLINAKTTRSAQSALAGLAGRRQRICRGLYERALSLSSELEHALDVDTDELPADFVPRLRTEAQALRTELNQALARAREGKILRQGVSVVLVGPPNAGKSSLMNALLEENRAIVSAEPGTTRDSIEEWLDLDGWPIRLIDTAGLRYAAQGESVGAIEAEGVRRAETLRDQADVVLALYDGAAADARTIPLHAKCDLGRGPGLNVSAHTGEGLEELKQAIVNKVRASIENESGAEGLSDEWRLTEVVALFPEWDRIWNSQDDLDLVLAANMLRTLSEKLGELLGATYSADLLDRLFSRFCVGK